VLPSIIVLFFFFLFFWTVVVCIRSTHGQNQDGYNAHHRIITAEVRRGGARKHNKNNIKRRGYSACSSFLFCSLIKWRRAKMKMANNDSIMACEMKMKINVNGEDLINGG